MIDVKFPIKVKDLAKVVDQANVNPHTMSDNKLIAEFMGLESFKDSLASLHNGKINVSVDLHKQAQYHTEWNWLMPVVQKCFDTQQPSEGQHYFINESLLTMDIDVVYDRVVEFIKEYNLEAHTL